MFKVPHARKHHRDPGTISGLDHRRVLDRSAGLDDHLDSGFSRDLDVVDLRADRDGELGDRDRHHLVDAERGDDIEGGCTVVAAIGCCPSALSWNGHNRRITHAQNRKHPPQ